MKCLGISVRSTSLTILRCTEKRRRSILPCCSLSIRTRRKVSRRYLVQWICLCSDRRRSSMAFIQANAGVKTVEKKPTSNSFGPTGGKTKIMFAMIDRDQDKYFGVSPEEVHAALIADKIDMDPMEIENDDDNMDITVDITNATVSIYFVLYSLILFVTDASNAQ